jgi:hypothetical protein
MAKLFTFLFIMLTFITSAWADLSQKDINALYKNWLDREYRQENQIGYERSIEPSTKFQEFRAEKAKEMHPAYRVVGILQTDEEYFYGDFTSQDAKKAIAAILTLSLIHI